MKDTFTFTNTDAGRALRDNLVEACKASNREFKFSEETVAGFVLLTLEVGRRVDEGQIARDVKVRKAQ